MATANLGRTLRVDKIYSRARDRVDTMRAIDDELVDEFEFPIVQPDVREDEETLARLMNPDEPTDSDPE